MRIIFVLILILELRRNQPTKNNQDNVPNEEELEHHRGNTPFSFTRKMIDFKSENEKLPKHFDLSPNDENKNDQNFELTELLNKFMNAKNSVIHRYFMICELVLRNQDCRKNHEKEIHEFNGCYNTYESGFLNFIVFYKRAINDFIKYINDIETKSLSNVEIKEMKEKLHINFFKINESRKWWMFYKKELKSKIDKLKNNSFHSSIHPIFYIEKYLETSIDYLNGLIHKYYPLKIFFSQLAEEYGIQLDVDY